MTVKNVCLATQLSTFLGVLALGCGTSAGNTESGGATDSATESGSSSQSSTSSMTSPTSGVSMSGTNTSEGSGNVSDSQATTGTATEGVTSGASLTSGPDTTTVGTTTNETTGENTTISSSTSDSGSTGGDTTTGEGSTGGGDTTGDGSTGGGSTTGDPLGCGDKLFATIRDFKTPHPDFETYCCGLVKGLVAPGLGKDQKPVFQSVGNPKMLTDAPTFNQWYNDVPNVNQKTQIVLNMTEIQPGLYSYTNSNFFPIDNMLWGNQGNNHNFHFTTRLDTS